MLEFLNHNVQVIQKEYTGEFFQKLFASDGVISDAFGYAVSASIDGQVLAISAHNSDAKGADSGAVYIFKRQANGSYIQTQKLTASDGAANDRFGTNLSLSVDGSVLVVGAYWDDDKGGNSGSAYVFTQQANGSYIQTQKLTASDGVASDWFGRSVAITDDLEKLFIGANGDDDTVSGSGSLYVFKRQAGGSYFQFQKLTSSLPGVNDGMGMCLSASHDGSVIAVGANIAPGTAAGSGAVDIFIQEPSGSYVWSQRLRAADQTANAAFGTAVAMSSSGDTLVIGAYGDSTKALYVGSAYVFTRQGDGTYTQMQKLTASDGESTDYFGLNVGVFPDGRSVFIGAPSDDNKQLSSGSVYQFDRQPGGSYAFTRKLFAPTQVASAQFGQGITVSRGSPVLVIGANVDTGKAASTGAVYIFK